MGPIEEGGELVAEAGIEENRTCPAGSGPEDVAIAEAAAGDQTVELAEVGAASNEVGHGQIYGFETGCVEGGSHFYLSIDALFSQHCQLRFCSSVRLPCLFFLALLGAGGSGFKREVKIQAGIFFGSDVFEFFAGGFGIVPLGLDPVGELGPGGMEIEKRGAQSLY